MDDMHTVDAMTTSTRSLSNTITDHKPIIIIDARPFSDYAKGHIPGAINLDLFAFHWNDTTYDGMRNFERQTARLFSFAGISKDSGIL